VSKVGHEPRGKVKRGNIHREHRICEIVESPAHSLSEWREWRIEIACRRHRENGVGIFFRVAE